MRRRTLISLVLFAVTPFLLGDEFRISPGEVPNRGPVATRQPTYAAVAAPLHLLSGETAISRQRNSDPNRPKVGVTRYLPEKASLQRTSDGLRSGGGVLRIRGASRVWGASFQSEGARSVRLHFSRFKIGRGVDVFVFNDSGEVHGPYTATEFASDFWSHSVDSDRVWVEVDVPDADATVDIEIDAVAHLDESVPDSNSACLVDVSCAADSQIKDWLSRATARLLFQETGGWYVCTGTILNDDDAATYIPYLLTANHCFSTQASASSLQATFKYRTPFCGGAPPSVGSLSSLISSTLLATSSASDFTFVRLNGTLPGNTSLMGWSGRQSDVAGPLYRVSNPGGYQQSFSVHQPSSVPTPVECYDAPSSSFVYSKASLGSAIGGSSGSPLATENGWVVGQLTGSCGEEDNCNMSITSFIDGRMSETLPGIIHWLRPSSEVQVCSPNTNTLCMQSNRFAVTLFARDPRSGATDSGLVMNSTSLFGYFAFAGMGSQTDPQIFVKVLDGRPVNGKWWVFYSALTDVEFTITVKDMTTNTTRTYHKEPYVNGAAGADLNAF